MVHGAFPFVQGSKSDKVKSEIYNENKEKIIMTEQKGLCNYNVQLQKASDTLDAHKEHLEDIKFMFYVIFAVMIVCIMVIILKKGVNSIKQSERKKISKQIVSEA